MFKGNSENIQRRERNQVLLGKKNDGIEHDVWREDRSASDDRKMELVSRKTEAEKKICQLNAALGEYGRRNITKEGKYAIWASERQKLVVVVAEIEKQLSAIRMVRAHSGKIEKQTFAEVFKTMAKEMLAGPVYDRLITATIHRCGEAEDVSQ